MKRIDVDGLVRCIEKSFMNNGFLFDVTSVTQEEVKDELIFNSGFGMIANEASEDSDFDVDIDESKFVNDKFYKENWAKVTYGDNTIAFVCINTEGDNLLISAMEINAFYRNYGFGKIIAKGIEMYAEEDGFERIVLHSFDTEAESFWEYIGYAQSDCGRMYKNI